MKKIFIVAAVVLVAFNLYFRITHNGDRRTPYSEFKTRIDMAPMREYHDPDFGHARFSFTDHANVVLESYVTQNRSHDLASCADSLARKLHSKRTMIPSKLPSRQPTEPWMRAA